MSGELNPEASPRLPFAGDDPVGGFGGLRRPLLIYASVLVALTVVVWGGARVGLVDYYAGSASEFAGSWLVGGWLRWDGGWYSDIASVGYFFAGPGAQSSVAFFPAYPLLIAVLESLTGLPIPLVGVLVTTAAGCGAALLFFIWCRSKASLEIATVATVLLLVYPYAWYLYGAVYADALFLCAALGSFVLLERGHPLLAGLAGAAATAARPVGVAVIIGLVAVVAMRRGVVRRSEGRLPLRLDPRAVERSDYWVLISASGLVAWMTYLWIDFGNPLAFQAAQSAPGWGQAPGTDTWLKADFFVWLAQLPDDVSSWLSGPEAGPAFDRVLYTIGLSVQALCALAAAALVPVVWRRLGWGYAVYAATILAIPLIGSKDFQGMGRYLLAAFPCFLAAGMLLSDRPVLRRCWIVISVALLGAWTFAYARGFYVA